MFLICFANSSSILLSLECVVVCEPVAIPLRSVGWFIGEKFWPFQQEGEGESYVDADAIPEMASSTKREGGSPAKNRFIWAQNISQ